MSLHQALHQWSPTWSPRAPWCPQMYSLTSTFAENKSKPLLSFNSRSMRYVRRTQEVSPFCSVHWFGNRCFYHKRMLGLEDTDRSLPPMVGTTCSDNSKCAHRFKKFGDLCSLFKNYSFCEILPRVSRTEEQAEALEWSGREECRPDSLLDARSPALWAPSSWLCLSGHLFHQLTPVCCCSDTLMQKSNSIPTATLLA